MVEAPTIWLVYAFADERRYGGNTGYRDVLGSRYEYDSQVQNSHNLKRGDRLVICGQEQVIGLAVAEQIDSSREVKVLRRCPECGRTGIKPRKTRSPRYRCNHGHEFEEPLDDIIHVVRFVADYGDSFVPLPEGMSKDQIRAFSSTPRAQLAIRRLDLHLDRLWQTLEGLNHNVGVLAKSHSLTRTPRVGLLTDDLVLLESKYVPDGVDAREWALRHIHLRRGQTAFRSALRQRYGDQCMISGCQLMDVVEAAHISPWRGPGDHNPENGLLLRSDLHTLFDLNALGIEPTTLAVRLSPLMLRSEYGALDGTILQCRANHGPSVTALTSRWRQFNEAL
jgi:hypothetical protein